MFKNYLSLLLSFDLAVRVRLYLTALASLIVAFIDVVAIVFLSSALKSSEVPDSLALLKLSQTEKYLLGAGFIVFSAFLQTSFYHKCLCCAKPFIFTVILDVAKIVRCSFHNKTQ